jgi:hypothetical protein
MQYIMTTQETEIWDGDDDCARDELRRDLRRDLSTPSTDVEVQTVDGITLFIVEAM